MEESSWRPYEEHDDTIEKQFYDVRGEHGQKIYNHFWPNAGQMNHLHSDMVVRPGEGMLIRPSLDHPMDSHEESQVPKPSYWMSNPTHRFFTRDRPPAPSAIAVPFGDSASVYHRGVTIDRMTRRERFYWRLPRWVRWMIRRTPLFKGVRPLRTKIVFNRILQPKIKDKT